MKLLTCFFSLLCLISCSSAGRLPDVGMLYDRTAQAHEADRNPIIVIPGILGSRLKDSITGQTTWGAFTGDAADPDTGAGARLIALPMESGVPLNDIETTVVPDGVLGRLQVAFLGFPLSLNAYYHILKSLGVGGYRDQELGEAGAVEYGPGHFTCFQFPYDWRRDVSYNAKLLHEFVLEKKAYVEEQYRELYGIERDVKFNIVAHSMGGLLTRYYLRYGPARLPEDGADLDVSWAGAKYVENAVLVGTPNAGSVDSLENIIEGRRFAPIFPRYETAILASMPAIYQLLPRSRHATYYNRERPDEIVDDILDPGLWIRLGWGLANPDQDSVLQLLLPEAETAEERRAIALDHLRKILLRTKQFQHALDKPADLPEGLKLSLFAGDAVPTRSRIAIDFETGKIKLTEKVGGDGIVPRSSALLDERLGGTWQPILQTPIDWSQVTFLFTDHLGMTKDPVFTDNILFTLLESPR